MPTKYEFDDLEKRYCELQNENHKLNVRFAESVAENSRFVEQLLVAEQMIEKLKGAISNAHSLIELVYCNLIFIFFMFSRTIPHYKYLKTYRYKSFLYYDSS